MVLEDLPSFAMVSKEVSRDDKIYGRKYSNTLLSKGWHDYIEEGGCLE